MATPRHGASGIMPASCQSGLCASPGIAAGGPAARRAATGRGLAYLRRAPMSSIAGAERARRSGGKRRPTRREGHMGGMSLWHWIIVLVIVVVLFGAGRIPRVMGDLAKGIKSFKAGMKDEEVVSDEPAKRVESGATIDGKAAHHTETTAPKA